MDGAPGADTEIEWQLDAQDLAVVQGWIEKAAAAGQEGGVSITPAKTINHVDTYLDTEDRRLDRAGYSVRLRKSRRHPTEATLKSLDGARSDALGVRRELAEDIEGDDPATVASTEGPVGARVRALVGSRKLVPVFDLQTRRRVYELANGETPSGELLLDETAIREPDGRLLSRLRRVEIEVPEPAVDAVAPLVESLQRACGLQPAGLSKYEAALAASGSERAEPESFGRTEIDPGDTIGHVGLAVLRRHFATLLAKEPGTRLGDDIEELHDMRVASRRLRAAVALLERVLPVEAAKLRHELAWVGQTIGVVRDLDVQLAQLDEWVEALPESDREPLARLRGLLTDERARARTAMLEALDSRRYERIVRRFGAMLRSRSGTRTAAARAVAPELVERRHRALRKAMKRIGPAAQPSDYHRARIADKRFRYALEFLADLYPGGTKRLVKQAVALQDLLGAHQDGDVAIARLRELAATQGADLGPDTVFAMGEIAERYRSSMEELRAQVPGVYAPLAGKRWKRFRKHMEAARPPVAPPAPRQDQGSDQGSDPCWLSRPRSSGSDDGVQPSAGDPARTSAKGRPMASATASRAALSDDDLKELVELIKEVDSVELKLTIPEQAHFTTVRALGLDPLQAQIRQVFFFDTPDLQLDKQGLVVRARRSQKKGDDTVVKLRPVVPSELPTSLRESPSFGVEVDASPKGYVCSGSLKGVPSRADVRAATSGAQPLGKLFSKEQRALFAEHAPEGVTLDDLTVLGPLFVLKLKGSPQGFGRKLVTEVWLYPDGSRILELSTKTEPSEAFQAAAETRAFFTSRGIDLGSEQQTKTRTALKYFVRELGHGTKRTKAAAPA